MPLCPLSQRIFLDETERGPTSRGGRQAGGKDRGERQRWLQGPPEQGLDALLKAETEAGRRLEAARQRRRAFTAAAKAVVAAATGDWRGGRGRVRF